MSSKRQLKLDVQGKPVLHLYVRPKVAGKSFKGVKVVTMPDQSMSLREILQRFIRKESLAISKEGTYADVGLDLEKLANADMVEQMEVADIIKDDLRKKKEGDARRKKEADAAAAAQAEKEKEKPIQKDPLENKGKAVD